MEAVTRLHLSDGDKHEQLSGSAPIWGRFGSVSWPLQLPMVFRLRPIRSSERTGLRDRLLRLVRFCHRLVYVQKRRRLVLRSICLRSSNPAMVSGVARFVNRLFPRMGKPAISNLDDIRHFFSAEPPSLLRHRIFPA